MYFLFVSNYVYYVCRFLNGLHQPNIQSWCQMQFYAFYMLFCQFQQYQNAILSLYKVIMTVLYDVLAWFGCFF